MTYRFIIIIPVILLSLSIATSNYHQPILAQTKLQIEDSTNKSIGDTSEVSLDWSGNYQGVLPCTDCEGIQTSITLHQDKSYVMETKYLGKDEQAFTSQGNFSWNKTGNTITLSNIEDAPSQYFVGENILIQLDMNGNKITGDLAEKYVLEKVRETDSNLTGVRWQLIEINGQPVSKKDIYIQFNADVNTVNGFDGCNLFSGGYELKDGNRLSFQKMIATMRACPDMGTEGQFRELLQKVNNYAIKDNVLSLHQAKMAPLLKFTALEAK